MYLAGGGAPHYRTLARFRRDNAAAFTAVFQETVVLALRLGLAKLGHVALDGTKLRANTSKHKAMSSGWMRRREAQLKEEIARLVAQAAAQDTADDQEYGANSDGYSVAEEMAHRAARLAKIQALRERLEAEQRATQGCSDAQPPAIEDKEQRSFADGAARMLLLKRGDYGSAYNAQAAVDEASGVIVAADLTNVGPDEGHLPALVGAVRTLRQTAHLDDQSPTPVSADAAYFSHANAAEDGAGIDLLRAAGRADPAARATTDGARFSFEVFGYDPAADEWACPAGKRLRRQVTPPGAMGRPVTRRYQADPTDCLACPLRACCLTPDETHRALVARRQRIGGAMRFKLRQPDAQRRYARRKVIVEPVFGQMKEDRGFTTLSLRGLLLARAEYLLACLAHNLGKLLRVCPLPVARATTVVVG